MRHIRRKIAPNAPKSSTPRSSTTPTQTNSSASIVFGIFELLENILLRLPLEDILLVSNTCNSARLVVENSKPITSRFMTLDSGYQAKARLVAGDSWSNDISFAFRFDLHLSDSSSFRVFVSQKDDCEAVTVVDRSATGRMKIVNGVNMNVTFTRPEWNEWKVEIYDAESGETMCGHVADLSCFLPQRWQADLERYLIRFHGGSGYDDCDDIVMMGRLVRGQVRLLKN